MVSLRSNRHLHYAPGPIPGAHYNHHRNPGNVARVAEGYRTEFHKVNYGAAHAIFITKSPGFLVSTEEEAIWQELNTDRFSTPLDRKSVV